MPIAPCATAGSIVSQSMICVACCVMFMRFRPASANMVASTWPSPNLRRRVCTFPRKLTTFQVGFMLSSCDFLRKDAEPITEPFGKSSRRLALLEMNTSRVSSRGNMQNSSIPSGNHVGTSFMECTAISTSPRSCAASISLVNKPLPPKSASVVSRNMSPDVLITEISMAPSCLSCGWASISLFRVSCACASASGEPRVPMTITALSDRGLTCWFSNTMFKAAEPFCILRLLGWAASVLREDAFAWSFV
mmetsp:Transcript_16560/g.28979  ORF Transcript_16560/g.28979 Transcript_16560/m.28979 type:complete len:249 (-) Transcript_16560:194-940(-)